MKALSLKQPWAWAVIHAGKVVENRTWKVKFRGPLLIHASKGCTREEYESAARWMNERGLASWPRWSDAGPPRIPDLDDLERGGIVGRARLVDIVPPCVMPAAAGDDAPAPCTCGRSWHMAQQFGFVLDDVRALPFTPARGLQRLFDLEEPAARTRIALLDDATAHAGEIASTAAAASLGACHG
jgi:hypothetical protein